MSDPINPDHYKRLGAYSPIDVAEAWKADPWLTHLLKYVGRAGYKATSDELEDLEKAKWFLNRKIDQLINSVGAQPNLTQGGTVDNSQW